MRQAALIGGLSILVTVFTAPFAEFVVYPKIAISGNIEETVQNFVANRGLFIAGIFASIVTFVCDVVAAWAFYVLLTRRRRQEPCG